MRGEVGADHPRPGVEDDLQQPFDTRLPPALWHRAEDQPDEHGADLEKGTSHAQEEQGVARLDEVGPRKPHAELKTTEQRHLDSQQVTPEEPGPEDPPIGLWMQDLSRERRRQARQGDRRGKEEYPLQEREGGGQAHC